MLDLLRLPSCPVSACANSRRALAGTLCSRLRYAHCSPDPGRGSLALFHDDFFLPFGAGHVSRPDPQADRGKNSRGTFSLGDNPMGRSGRLRLRHPP